jgi:hypothetical protein
MAKAPPHDSLNDFAGDAEIRAAPRGNSPLGQQLNGLDFDAGNGDGARTGNNADLYPRGRKT